MKAIFLQGANRCSPPVDLNRWRMDRIPHPNPLPGGEGAVLRYVYVFDGVRWLGMRKVVLMGRKALPILRISLIVILVLSFLSSYTQADEVSVPCPIQFVDRTREVGLDSFRHRLGNLDKRWIIDAMGSGVAVGDFDNDGDDDIYFVNGRPDFYQTDPAYRNALFRNDGGNFIDVTDAAGVGDLGYGMCAVFGDVDGDDWLDLFVGNDGPNVLYRNNGNGTFSDVTADCGVGDDGYAASACFVDVEGDGDLDLFVGNYVDFDPKQHGHFRANYYGTSVFMGPMQFDAQRDLLYINDGAGRFKDASYRALINPSRGRAMGAAFFDLENDGDPDLYVTNDSTYNHILQNRGDGTFNDLSFLSGGGYSDGGQGGASMGVSAGDYNNDGLADLLITSYDHESDVLYRNLGEGMLSDETAGSGLFGATKMRVTWGSGFCDFDADGWLDIYTVNGHVYPQVDDMKRSWRYAQGASVYRNKGGRFDDLSERALPENITRKSGRGSALLDYDGDGDMDVVVNCIDSTPLLLENRSERGHWMQVKLAGTSAQTYGVRVVAQKGERIWMRQVEGGSGYLSQNSAVLHFGFGEVDALDRLTVYWRHREAEVVLRAGMDRRIVVGVLGF